MPRLIDADIAQRIADDNLSFEDAGTVQWVLSHTPTVKVAGGPRADSLFEDEWDQLPSENLYEVAKASTAARRGVGP